VTPRTVVAGQFIGWLKSDAFSARVTAVRLVSKLPSDRLEPPTTPEPDALYFRETGHYVNWVSRTSGSHMVLAYFGFPITEEFSDIASDGHRSRCSISSGRNWKYVKATA